jgi:hypothetical protein
VGVKDERKAKLLSLMHYGAACLWLLLSIPTVLIWKNSILWIAFMSIYAIVIAHLSAAQASRAEQSSEENGDG